MLVAAHARGIVHRDLKPDNIFLEHGGRVRVLDFGIARVAGSPDATACGTVMGTPGFMAPEQARGRMEDVGPRTDVWAAGALLYTLLTGRLLHDAPNPIASVVRAQSEPVPPARELVPGVSDAVAHVLDGALAFDVAQRWMDATAMRWAVRAALDEARARGATTGSCPGVAVEALGERAARGGRSDAPVAVEPQAPAWSGWTWPPMPWLAAVASAAMVLLVAAGLHALTPASAPVAAVAPPPVATIPPATTALLTLAPRPTAPAAPPPAVDVDALPAVAPVASAHRAPRTRARATEIVRKLDF